MSQNKIETICLHSGTLEDPIYKGAISPIYMSTAYQFNDVDEKRYPRYINTPNQEGLCKKIVWSYFNFCYTSRTNIYF